MVYKFRTRALIKACIEEQTQIDYKDGSLYSHVAQVSLQMHNHVRPRELLGGCSASGCDNDLIRPNDHMVTRCPDTNITFTVKCVEDMRITHTG